MRLPILPATDRRVLRKAALLAVAGALIAGAFGIVHDQITFTISPEYFTRMKFDQFRAFDFGLPPRLLVAEIGFLATWWVGLIAGWFMARVAVPKFTHGGKIVLATLALLVVFTAACGVAGYFAGPSLLAGRAGWDEALDTMAVTDVVAFQRVAGIHLAGYGGALIGFLAAMAALWQLTPTSPPDARKHPSS